VRGLTLALELNWNRKQRKALHEGGATRRGGGAAAAAAGGGSAFTPHDWETSVVIIALWTDPSAAARAACERWADAAFHALRPFAKVRPGI
jgi:hypothetical protein